MNCEWKGCPKEATHSPKVFVPAEGWPIDMHQPIGLVLSLKCCIEHARGFEVTEFLEGEKIREIFEIMLRGKQPPDFSRAYVEALPLDHPEVKMLEAQRR